ncbi:MauE/DoxX family redox-associated membrane protein [Sphingobacterium kitahiroshimense]|uniref:MauE/DoxX family redox-associated membrane protein n=1 Tax=Sphingobacterium kitahiroshimense TaxID=470446 RepID=UPI00320A7C3D
MKRKITIAILIFIGILFMYAGISKLLDYSNFVVQLDNSPLIPDRMTNLIALGLPSVEILVAGALCFDSTRKASVLLTFGIMLTFTIYLIILVTFFSSVPCSCGGILGKMSYPIHIIFNIIVTAMSAFACLNVDEKK